MAIPSPVGWASLVEEFRRQGYVTVPGFLTPEAAGALAEAVAASPERDPGHNPLTLGTMRFASNLFYGSPVLQAFLSSNSVVELVTTILGPDTWVRWDQAVWKHPGAPEFPMHQDNGYTNLPAEHLQLWVALTAATADDGGLVVVPGGHRQPLEHRWVGDHATADVSGPRVAIEAAAGDVIAFSSYLPHATTSNTSDHTRLAYVAEFLPLDVADPSVRLPHFVASRHGAPFGGFRDQG